MDCQFKWQNRLTQKRNILIYRSASWFLMFEERKVTRSSQSWWKFLLTLHFFLSCAKCTTQADLSACFLNNRLSKSSSCIADRSENVTDVLRCYATQMASDIWGVQLRFKWVVYIKIILIIWDSVCVCLLFLLIRSRDIQFYNNVKLPIGKWSRD